MAEHVIIKIEVNADTKTIERVRAQLRLLKKEGDLLDKSLGKVSKSAKNADDDLFQLGRQAKTTQKNLGDVGKESDRVGNSASRLRQRLNHAQRGLRDFDKHLATIGKRLQGAIKFGLKAMLVNIAALSLALLVVSGSFTISRLAVKLWQATLTASASVGAGVVAVLAGLAAGQREYNAALQAYNYKHSVGLTAGTQEAMAQMRGLATNVNLAVLGTQALNQAFAAISSSTQVNGALTAAMEAFGDFAASSGDPAKSIVAAGDFLGRLVKGGAITQELIASAADVGPAFQLALAKGMKDLNIKTSGEFISALTSGQLSGGVSGQLDAVNNTLFGTAKRSFTLIKEQFADLGQGFLPEFTGALERISNIVSTNLMRISASINHFASGTMMDGLVSGFEKITRWASDLFIEYLPKGEGMFDRIANRLNDIGDFFKGIADWARPLQEGAQVLKDAFGPLFKSFFIGFTGGMESFNKLLIDNREEFMEFGRALKDVFGGLFEIMGNVKKAFASTLPLLTDIVDMIGLVVDAVGTLTGWLSGSQIGSAGMLGGLAVGFHALGGLAKSRGGTGKGGLLSRFGQVAGVTSGKGSLSSSVATMTVATMNVGMMNGGIGAAGLNAAGGVGAGAYGPALPGGAAPVLKGMARFRSFMKTPMARVGLALGVIWGGMKVMQNKGTGSNIAGGAAMGAGIGGFYGPGGMAIGAAVGATAGFAYDKVYGGAARNKKSARSAASQVADAYDSTTLDYLNRNDMAGARGAMTGFATRNEELKAISERYFSGQSEFSRKINAEDLKKQGLLSESEASALAKAPDTYLKSLEMQEKELREKTIPIIHQFDLTLSHLGRTTGASSKEILESANNLEIALGGTIENLAALYSDIMGFDVATDRKMLMQGVTDTFWDALDSVTQHPIALQEAGIAVDQRFEQLAGMVEGGGTLGEGDAAAALRDVIGFEMQRTFDPLTGKSDPAQALKNAQAMIGSKSGRFYQEGTRLEGMGDEFAPVFSKMLKDMELQWKSDRVLRAITAINAMPGQSGMRMKTTDEIAAMSEREIAALESKIGTVFDAPAETLLAAGNALLAYAASLGFKLEPTDWNGGYMRQGQNGSSAAKPPTTTSPWAPTSGTTPSNDPWMTADRTPNNDPWTGYQVPAATTGGTITNNFKITQLPGESATDLASKVIKIMSAQMKSDKERIG